MLNILHINLISGRSGAAGLCQSLVEGVNPDLFSSTQLVGYDFGPKSQTNVISKYSTNSSWLYRTFRYKGFVGLNFLFELMTYQCIDYAWLTKQDFYKQSDIIHLHCIQGGYFNWHDLPHIAREKKVIMTLHDDWLVSGNDKNNSLFPYKTIRQYHVRKNILEKVSLHYVGVSHWMTQKVLSDPIRGNNPVTTIYNGIDTKVFKKNDKAHARNLLGLPLDKTIIVSIAGSGSKSNIKGLHFVKKIADEYTTDSSLLFLTLGNHKSKSYQNIIELPFVSKDEVALYFAAADIFLYPTLADSFGLVVAESLACGCPVLTFATGGVPEIVQHKKNSYVAEYKNFDDLKKGFSWMLANKNDLSVTLDQKFSLNHMISAYQKLYLSL